MPMLVSGIVLLEYALQVIVSALFGAKDVMQPKEELVVTSGMGQYSMGVLGFGEIGRASGAGGGKRGGSRPMLAWVSGNKAFL